MNGQKRKDILGLFILTAIAAALLFAARPILADETNTNANSNTNTSQAPDVSDLQSQVQDKQKHINDLQQQQAVLEANLAQKQQESMSLKNQISILDDQISDTDISVQKLALQIDLVNSDIEQADSNIQTKQEEIMRQKDRLGEMLRVLNRYHNRTTLEITLLNQTFSDFYNQMKYLQTVEAKAKDSLDVLSSLKKDLELDKKELVAKRQDSEEKKRQQSIEKANLTSQQGYRTDLLDQTQESEQQYEALLNQSKQEQLGANQDIQTLEAQIRQRLTNSNELPADPSSFIWPVDSRRVTATFHDPSYPFRKYFEHPAIDIATPQGTPIRAVASGFVGIAKNGGMGYSYIMLVHGKGLSSVYGHVSQINVVQGDFVVQGQVIGLSGATPGTPGAGRLTTGPHLHLEIRLDGIPVNPLNYLP